MGKLILAELEDEDLVEQLGLSNDMELDDFDLEAYREPFWAYLPDYLGDLAPLDEQTLCACNAAAESLQRACRLIADSAESVTLAKRFLQEESVSSARIEGIDATMETLAELERLRTAGARRRDLLASQSALDIADVLGDYACNPQRTISVDEICEINGRVASTSNVAERCGCLRETQVWIGGISDSISDAAYVPPPAEYLDDYMRDLRRYIERGLGSGMNPVALAALAHAQLALVHPFEDGNGRTARILSQLVLCWSGLTRGVVVPVSKALLERRSAYIDMLVTMQEAYGVKADPNQFVRFFCWAVEEAARFE